MTMSEYLQIKAVSAGVLRTLIDECPYAAWYSSPFNPTPPPADDTDASDAGTICHSILLEGSTEKVKVFDPADYPNLKGSGTATRWSNKGIRTARDEARDEGLIPILKEDFANVTEAVYSAQRLIRRSAYQHVFEDVNAASEQTVVFDDGGLLCKVRPDRKMHDSSIIVDAKFPAAATSPAVWGRAQLIGRGLYLSAVFYQRIVEMATGICPEYVFLVTPTEPPHLGFFASPAPDLLALGHRKIDAAVREWRACAKNGDWPKYDARTHYVEAPPWELARQEEREIMNLGLGSQP